MVEEIKNVNQQELMKHFVDPGQRAEGSPHPHHSTSGYRDLGHTFGLWEHPRRLVAAVHTCAAGARRDRSKAPTRTEAEFKDRFTWARVERIDGQSVGLFIDPGHQPSNDQSNAAARVSQLTTKGVPNPVGYKQTGSCISDRGFARRRSHLFSSILARSS